MSRLQTYYKETVVPQLMEQLKLGTVHMYAEGSAYMKKWIPEITWISAAFLFDDREHWVRFMNTPLVKGWYAAAAAKAGIQVLGDPTAIMRGPYRVMVTTRDVKAFKEMFGLTRKLAIPLLETLDGLGVTARRGNERVVLRRSTEK